MSNSNHIYSNIDTYLKGELRGEDLQEFENALLHDLKLIEELKKARAIQKLFFQNRLLQVKELAKLEEARLGNQKSIGKQAIIGGSLLILTLTGFGVYIVNQKETAPAKPVENQVILQQNSKQDKLSKTQQDEPPAIKPKDKAPNTIKSQSKGNNKNLISTNTDSLVSKPDTILPIADITDSLKPDLVVIADIKNSTEDVLIDKKESNNPCEKAALKATISNTETCKGSTEGKIEVSNIQGTYPPYVQRVYFKEKEIYDYSNLKAGSYELVISDSKNCQKTFPVQIIEKLCPINDHFNPTYGEVWNIPEGNKSGKLHIYSKSGLPVYQMNIKHNTPATWNGKDNYDQLEAGYFIFVIEYEDGQVLKGSVTITL